MAWETRLLEQNKQNLYFNGRDLVAHGLCQLCGLAEILDFQAILVFFKRWRFQPLLKKRQF